MGPSSIVEAFFSLTVFFSLTDLGIMEWIIPVGGAERAGDREGESEMQTGILTRERKKRAIGGENQRRGRERGRQRERERG